MTRWILVSAIVTLSCGARSNLIDIAGDPDVPANDGGSTDAGCAGAGCSDVDPCTSIDCNDQDECTLDTCIPETGSCEHQVISFDRDGDGYHGARPGFETASPGACGDDCDDTSPLAHPGGIESCDGVDNDCNGVVDDGATYVASTMQDVLVSHPDQTQAIAADLAWNGSVFLASWGGDDETGNFSGYASRLTPSGGALVGETLLDMWSGPVVWTGAQFGFAGVKEGKSSSYMISFGRMDGQGAILDTPFVAPAWSGGVDLGWNGAEFMLVWDDLVSPFDGEIRGQRIGISGEPVGEPASLVGGGAYGPRVARGSTSFGVALELFGEHSGVGMRIFTPELQPGSPLIEISMDDAVEPSIAFSGGRYFIAYGKKTAAPAPAIWGAIVAQSGALELSEKQLTTGASFARDASLIGLGDRLLMVWADDHDGNYELYSQMLSLDLDVIAPRERITFDGASSISPAAAFGKDGELGVLFEDDRSGSWRVYFNRLVCVPGG